MRPLEHPLLLGWNIHPAIAAALVRRGLDARTVREEGLVGRDDAAILAHAFSLGRVVITHDRDYGQLAIAQGAPFLGIVYLRPGHIVAAFVLDILAAVERLVGEAHPPFIVVAERRADSIRVRLRDCRET